MTAINEAKSGAGFNSYALIILIIILTAVLNVNALNDSIYIDPTNKGDRNMVGSIENPYDTWDKVSIAGNTAYLQKRGTTTWFDPGQTEMNVMIDNVSNVIIGAYGEGERPNTRIYFTARNSSDITFEDIDGKTIDLYNCKNALINNCVIHDEYMGIHITRCENVKVFNTEIYNMELDGMMGSNSKNIEIGGSRYLLKTGAIYLKPSI